MASAGDREGEDEGVGVGSPLKQVLDGRLGFNDIEQAAKGSIHPAHNSEQAIWKEPIKWLGIRLTVQRYKDTRK